MTMLPDNPASLELQPPRLTDVADNPMGKAIDEAEALRERAVAIIKEGHDPKAIMQSALSDLRGMGNLTGMIAIMQTGKFSQQQMVLAERLAVKIIAYCALMKSA